MRGKVLVIDTKKLLKITGGDFQGFKQFPESIFEQLGNDSQWMDESDAMARPDFKEIIGYCAITSPSDRIFTYKRSKQKENYPEERLWGNWSLGVGGHVEYKFAEEKISASIGREINEEVDIIDGIKRISMLGIINDDSNSVGKDHFGLLLLIETFSEKVMPKDEEIAIGGWGFRTYTEISELFDKEPTDNWSKICLSYI